MSAHALDRPRRARRGSLAGSLLTVFFSLLSVAYVFPVALIFINSLKSKSSISAAPFALPDAGSFVGITNFLNGIASGSYPFYRSVLYSFFITLASTLLILLCTGMCAWYINRVNSRICKLFYLLCAVSMVVPFQTVMYTLPQVANRLHLDNPYGITVIYLGFGAGLAVFLFSGFVRSMPAEIEEAALIDGCTPPQTYFRVVLPILRPTVISVSILELMWIWNDYLLPYMVLDRTQYMTIPIQIQYLNAGYGQTDIGAMMAMIVFSIIPIVVFYLIGQKGIVSGIIAGAVKG